MSIQLSPPTHLTFPCPPTSGPIIPLTIRNPGPTPLAFKLKTTAPSRYAVRPNQGVIAPEKRAEVWIRHTAARADPGPNAKCKDKFLIQVVAVSEQEADEDLEGGDSSRKLTEFWESVKPTRIVEYKLRCAYAPAGVPSLGSRLAGWFARMCQPTSKKQKDTGKDGYKLMKQ